MAEGMTYWGKAIKEEGGIIEEKRWGGGGNNSIKCPRMGPHHFLSMLDHLIYYVLRPLISKYILTFSKVRN